MKNKSLIFSGVLILLQFCCQISFAQNPISPMPPIEDYTENITGNDSDNFLEKISSGKFNLERFVEPQATFINFDDLRINQENSGRISPYRYAGVRFYSPGTETFLTYFQRYSYPNSLIVGIMDTYPNPQGFYNINSVNNLQIEFAQNAKDVSFLWGTSGYYNTGQVQIYNESNQLVATVPVNFGGYQWVSLSLSQYSQRIKGIVLIRPPVSNTYYGHISIDNFQFTPVTTASPVGYLDNVSIQQGEMVKFSDTQNSRCSCVS
jgi:hypothetical protein